MKRIGTQKSSTEQTMAKDGINKEEIFFKADIDKMERQREYEGYSSWLMFEDDYKCEFDKSYVKNKKEANYRKSFERFCENFKNFYKQGFGIYISGDPGTGKSHYSNCIYNELKKDFVVYKTSLQRLFDEIIENFGEKTPTDFLRKRLSRADLIIFEDLGNEFLRDWHKQIIFFVFDYIYNAKKSVIINTNLSDEQATEFFRILGTDKLLSRMRSKCKYYKFEWEDRREGMYKDEIAKWY